MPTSVKRDLTTRLKVALDQDTFVRSNVSSGWGTPTLGRQGSSWVTNSGLSLSVTSNQGKATGNISQDGITLGSLTLSNCEALCTFSTSATANSFGIFLRSSSINNQYRFRYQNGNFFITLVLSATSTQLSTTSFTVTPTTGTYCIRARCMGPVLCGKIWDSTTTEPTSWTAVVSDRTFTSGNYGVYSKLNSTSDTNFYSSFAVFDTRMQVDVPLRTVVLKPQDVSTRVSLLRPRFLSTRAIIWAAQDLFTRINVLRPKNISSRVVIRIVNDLFSRLRLLSNMKRDIFTRTILIRPRNVPFRLIFKDISKHFPSRLRLSILSQRSLFTRFNLYIPTYKDFFTRLPFAGGGIGDLYTHLNLTLPDAWDTFTRLILANPGIQDLATRLIFIPTQQKSLLTRMRLLAQALRDVPARLCLQVTQFPVLATRIIFLIQSQRDVPTRLNLYLPTFPAARTLVARLLLVPSPTKDTSDVLPPILGYRGQGVLPTGVPTLPYMVNNVILDTQPYVCSTPLTQDGNVIPAGSTFVLLFANPSFATFLALTDGSSVTMRFGLAQGDSATGQVLLSSTVTGTTLEVVATIQNDITLNTRTILTQFF